ncbi:ABC transporter permease [Streptomyces sp. ACA25]|uniref:ABC transporter permease n=1 Tax=Streptomyces sp. ACA25 TaxID=3022596 RepID=UPI0023073513|nr:ABC transporter permease [Streptomyces sp. ACA25]MDB1086194.1 ABC transporter permease [Streptomyces sp. ACA25]
MSPEPTTPADTPRADARIHNIGYRHYDGERLGRPYARRSLFVHSLRGAYGIGRSAKSKVLPFALFAVMCLPAIVMVAIAITVGMDELPFAYTSYALFMQPILGLYLALTAPQLVSLDLRFHTIPLYFSRPLERVDYVLAKLGALIGALLLFIGAPLLLMYAGALLGELSFTDQTRGFAQGVAGAVVFSVLHAAIALLIASLTPRRGFGVAAIIAVLTIPYFAVTAVQGVSVSQGATDAVGWLGLGSPGTLMDGFQQYFLGGTSEFPDGYLLTGAEAPVYVLVIVGLTALSVLLLLRRYRKAGI